MNLIIWFLSHKLNKSYFKFEMKIKRNKDGKFSGKTVRSFNYKNQEALGKKAISSMIECGAKGALK